MDSDEESCLPFLDLEAEAEETPWDDSSLLAEFEDMMDTRLPMRGARPTRTGTGSENGRRRTRGRTRASLEQQRSWFVTWNNPEKHLDPDQNALEVIQSLPTLKRAVMGLETAPTTGTKHLQGFVRFSQPQRRWWVEEKLPGVWVERLKNEKAAEIYAAKEKLVLDYGSEARPAPPESAFSRALEGDLGPLMEATTASWKFQNLQKLRLAPAYGPTLGKSPSVRPVPYVIWLYGESGAGKSTFASSLVWEELKTVASAYALSNPDPKKSTWWDGYTPKDKIVVMDDLRASTMSSGNFCQAISSLPYRVDSKNVTVDFSPLLVVVTCPVPPWKLWSLTYEEGGVDQVVRRVNLCAEFLFAPSEQTSASAPKMWCTSWTPPPDIAALAGSASVTPAAREGKVWAEARAKRLATLSRWMWPDWFEEEGHPLLADPEWKLKERLWKLMKSGQWVLQ